MARLVPYQEAAKIAAVRDADELGRIVARDLAVTELAKHAGAMMAAEGMDKEAFGALLRGAATLGKGLLKAPKSVGRVIRKKQVTMAARKNFKPRPGGPTTHVGGTAAKSGRRRVVTSGGKMRQAPPKPAPAAGTAPAPAAKKPVVELKGPRGQAPATAVGRTPTPARTPAGPLAKPGSIAKATAPKHGFLRRNWKPIALGTAGLGAMGAVHAAPKVVRTLEEATASPWAYGAGWSPTPYGYGHTPYGPGTPTMGAR